MGGTAKLSFSMGNNIIKHLGRSTHQCPDSTNNRCFHRCTYATLLVHPPRTSPLIRVRTTIFGLLELCILTTNGLAFLHRSTNATVLRCSKNYPLQPQSHHSFAPAAYPPKH